MYKPVRARLNEIEAILPTALESDDNADASITEDEYDSNSEGIVEERIPNSPD